MAKICIKIGKLVFFAESTNENPETEKRVLKQLPIKGFAQRWDEEIYFLVLFDISLEAGKQECWPGEIRFWSDVLAVAISFGKTLVSTSGRSGAYSPRNFFVRLSGNLDKQALNAVKDCKKITVSKTKQGTTST